MDIFITATNTDIGKSYTALRIIKELGDEGIKVGAFKPIETGVTSVPQDAALLLEAVQHYNPSFQKLTPHDITSYTFSLPAAPFCANDGPDIKLEQIIAKYHHLRSLCEVLIVEGAGGLMVPIGVDFFMIDLIKALKTPALLVASDKLGGINDLLLSLNSLKQAHIPHQWILNQRHDDATFDSIMAPFLKGYFGNFYNLKKAHNLKNCLKNLTNQ